jgi:hypothetical protein
MTWLLCVEAEDSGFILRLRADALGKIMNKDNVQIIENIIE